MSAWRRCWIAVLLIISLLQAPVRSADDAGLFPMSKDAADLINDVHAASDAIWEGSAYWQSWKEAWQIMGHAFSIGDAISQWQSGDTEGATRSVASWGVDTGLGWTAYGPYYAMYKLSSSFIVGTIKANYGFSAETNYASYYQLRRRQLPQDLSGVRLQDVVAWANQGKATFDGFQDTWAYPRQTLEHYRLQMLADATNRLGWWKSWVAGVLDSPQAKAYRQAVETSSDTQAQLRYIYQAWEMQAHIDFLNEVVAFQDQRRQQLLGTVYSLHVTFRDASNNPVVPRTAALRSPGGAVIATADAVAGDMAGLLVSFADLAQKAPKGEVQFAVSDGAGRTYTSDVVPFRSLLAGQWGRGVWQDGLLLIEADVGGLRVRPDGRPVQVTPAGGKAPVRESGLDPVGGLQTAALSEAAGQFWVTAQAAAGTVRGLVTAWVTTGAPGAGGERFSQVVALTPDAAAAPVQITVPTPDPVPDDGSLLSIEAAMDSEYQRLLAGQIRYGLFTSRLQTLQFHLTYPGATVSATQTARQAADAYAARLEAATASSRDALLATYRGRLMALRDRLQAIAARPVTAAPEPDWRDFAGLTAADAGARLQELEQQVAARNTYLDGALAAIQDLDSLESDLQSALTDYPRDAPLLDTDLPELADIGAQLRDLRGRWAPAAAAAQAGQVAGNNARLTAARADAARAGRDHTAAAARQASRSATAQAMQADAVPLLAHLDTLRSQGKLVLLGTLSDLRQYLERYRALVDAGFDRTRASFEDLYLIDALPDRLRGALADANAFLAAVRQPTVGAEPTGTFADLAPILQAYASARDYLGIFGPLTSGDLLARLQAAPAVASQDDLDAVAGSGQYLGGYLAQLVDDLDAVKDLQPALRPAPVPQRRTDARTTALLQLTQGAMAGLEQRIATDSLAALVPALQTLDRLLQQTLAAHRAAPEGTALDEAAAAVGRSLYGEVLPAWWTRLEQEAQALADAMLATDPHAADIADRAERFRITMTLLEQGTVAPAAARDPAYALLFGQSYHSFASDNLYRRRLLSSATVQAPRQIYLVLVGTEPGPGAAAPVEVLLTLDSSVGHSNGQTVGLEAAPLVVEGRSLVPLRFVAQSLGALVQWNAAERSATLVLGERTVTVTIDSRQALVDGRPVTLEVAPVIVNGRTLVPLRFVAESLGATVTYNPETREIRVRK